MTSTTAPEQQRQLDFSVFFNVIDGQLSMTRQTRHSVNPSTLKPNPEVPVSTLDDVDRAVAAARKAFPAWRDVSPAERSAALVAFADALGAHADAFAHMLTSEQGRPLKLAQFEVQVCVDSLRQSADVALGGDEVVTDMDDHTVVKRYTPLGVACGIVPWNFPVNIAATKMSAALRTGNTFIMKPSPFTPYCNLKMVELAQRFFPPGVVQCLSGDDSLGKMLTEHPDIDKISFTGSVATGKRVMESCSRTLKRVTLELGGNDAAIIYPDVDIQATAAKVVTRLMFFVPFVAQASFINTSQRIWQLCVAVKRVYVHKDIYSEFRTAFAAAVKAMPIGDGFSGSTFMGPLTTEMQYKRVQELLADVKATNLTVVDTGDSAPSSGGDAGGKGYFIKPVVVDNPPDTARVVVEEPFGPIVPLLQWSDEADVIRRTNDTKYGLGASIWTKDVAHAAAVSKQIESGTVWINAHMLIDHRVPFGGHKWSGIGIENGIDGLKAYCNLQVVYLAKI